MSKDAHIADIIVHLHPDTSCNDTGRIERDLRAHDGVVSVHFDKAQDPHAMVVAFNTETIKSGEILAEVRKCDIRAMIAGM